MAEGRLLCRQFVAKSPCALFAFPRAEAIGAASGITQYAYHNSSKHAMRCGQGSLTAGPDPKARCLKDEMAAGQGVKAGLVTANLSNGQVVRAAPGLIYRRRTGRVLSNGDAVNIQVGLSSALAAGTAGSLAGGAPGGKGSGTAVAGP
jgi:hypothetical protein